MLKIIMFMFNRLNSSLTSYMASQDAAIAKIEENLAKERQDLLTAEKLAKKFEI